jgi:hypothetical protein
MSRTIKSKEDIEFHSDGYRPGNPAVNVKVYDSISSVKLPICLGGSHPAGKPEEFKWHYTEPEFTADWVEEHLTDEEYWDYFNMACELGWEELQNIADDIWQDTWHHPKVYSEGRSGGWAVVHNLPDVESWDAIMLAKWRKFSRIAKATAEYIPEQVMTTIYFNRFEEL